MSDDEHERAFVPTDGLVEERARRNALSEPVRARTAPTVIAYGASERERLDVYRPERPNGAAALFFHGGYWQSGDRDSSAFVAGPLLDAGVTAVIAGYDLCPSVTLPAIVHQARAARDALLGRAGDLGLDTRRLLVMGSSAGAQLVAMLLLDGPQAWPAPPSAVLISGMFDLEAALRTSANRALRLSANDVATLSPLRRDEPFHAHAMLAAVGANESEPWRAMVAAFAERAARDVPVRLMVMPERNHFSITTGLGRAADPLTRAALALISANDG